jgi:alpha-mannosidase
MLYVNGTAKGIFSKELETGARGYHHTIKVYDPADSCEELHFALECYAGHPCVGTHPMDEREATAFDDEAYRRRFRALTLVTRRDTVKDFVFDLKTLNQLVGALPESSFRRGDIIRALVEVFKVVPQAPKAMEESTWMSALETARQIMAPLLDCKNTSSAPRAGITGHSHMDTAWLWTSKETIRKCARTFSNALNLMDQYDEYRFVQSSPIHTEMVRQNYPEIFEKVKEKVAEGRWEPNGGMYVESDGNMPSGESFCRQFIYGQAYTWKHFKYRADTFWLPDTFGYSAALPQIMKECGIKYFLTTKLTWNESNSFPYDTFKWEGIDGTEVLVHFNETHCWPDPETLIDRLEGGVQKDFRTVSNCVQHKENNKDRLISYGFGDGGGGPMYEMLEMARRAKDLEGCPKTEHTSVSDFMAGLEKDQERYPTYYGELYVEGHRGVQTVQHEIKRLNRRLEEALRSTEMLLLSLCPDRADYPELREKIEQIWKVLLKNQFHDILPGTSIPEEHQLAKREMAEAIVACQELRETRLSPSPSAQLTVFQPFSWEHMGDVSFPLLDRGVTLGHARHQRQDIESLDGVSTTVVENLCCPALEFMSFDQVTVEESSDLTFSFADGRLVTPHYEVELDEYGYITKWMDIKHRRRIDAGKRPLNSLLFGEDIPLLWDNWDIDVDQHAKMNRVEELLNQEVISGPLQFRLRHTYRLGSDSTLWQDMVFHKNSRRVDFETKVDWREAHSHLKTAFDFNICSKELKSETQFGHVTRPLHGNTSFDRAKFEVCQHRWSNVSEPQYGVTIINDSNYGIGHLGNELRLSLLKSGGHPDPSGDAGIHFLKYAVLPHAGPFSARNVIKEAQQFNQSTLNWQGTIEEKPALVTCSSEHIFIDTLKFSEDGGSIVARIYEAEGSSGRAHLTFGFEVEKVELTNVLEEHQLDLTLEGDSLALELAAFEIKTIKFKLT